MDDPTKQQRTAAAGVRDCAAHCLQAARARCHANQRIAVVMCNDARFGHFGNDDGNAAAVGKTTA